MFIGSNEKIESKVLVQLQRMVQPNINSFNIEWGTTGKVSPCYLAIPPAYYQSRVIVYAFATELPEVATAKLKYFDPVALSNKEIAFTYGSKVAEKGSMVHSLAAKSQLFDFENYPAVVSKQLNITQPAIKNEIIRLGEKYGLGTKHTSFIAISKKKSNSASKVLEQSVVPNQLPQNALLYVHIINSNFAIDRPFNHLL